MKYLLLILIIVGGLVFGALNYHVILLDSSLKVLKKPRMTLESPFVDARGTKKFKHLRDPVLLRAGFDELLEAEGITPPPRNAEPPHDRD
jgi:hypothetical protein